jgi:hypothetical protein
LNFKREQPMRLHQVSTYQNLQTKLEAANRQIALCIEDLEAVTSDVPPVSTQLSAVRLRIGKAILARRPVTHEAYSRLLSAVPADDVAAVRDLQQRDQAQFYFTSEIIRRWTPQMVKDDWQGYCVASRMVRDGMRAIIAAEKRLLYPLLDALL